MISVIIRTFNDGKFIKKAVKSALNQSFDNYEIIIVNDGSTDNTKEIVERFIEENSGKNIKLINQENKGAFESAYAGLNNAKGEFIIFLDADDEFMEDTLAELYQAVESGSCGFSYCDYYEVNLDNGEKKYMSLDNIFNGFVCGMLFKRSVIDDIGFWEKKFLMPEYDFLIRVMKKYQGIHVKKHLYIYNKHNKSMSADKEYVAKAKQQIFEKYGRIEGFKKY